MRSAFFGLHVATSAMNVARGNLHTIAHNIANVQTPGFSRQVAVQQATNPLRMGQGRGMIGTGAEIISVNQIRSFFLDHKFWNQSSVLGQFAKKDEILSLTQGILAETRTSGLSFEIDQIMNRLSELGTHPESVTHRRNFLSGFESLATLLNSQFSQLRQQQVDINLEIRSTVGMINSIGRQIASLNRQITVMELDGSNANDLRDRRALLLDQLSAFVNIDVREVERNPEVAAGRDTDPRNSRRELQVFIDGQEFINHFTLSELEVRQRILSDGTNVLRNPEEPPRMYDIFFANGRSFNMYSRSLSGELAGLINLRDGNGNNHLGSTRGDFVYNTDSAGSFIEIDFNQASRMDIGPSGEITLILDGGRHLNVRYTDIEYIPMNTFPPEGVRLRLYDGDIPTGAADYATFVSNINTNAARLTVGQTTSYLGIPYFMSRLNDLARTLSAAFNQAMNLNGSAIAGVPHGHVDAFDINGNRGQWLLGYQGFDDWTSGSNGFMNYFNINASNFMINPDMLHNPGLLAITISEADGPGEMEVLKGWLALTENRSLFREGRLGDFLAAITGDLGVVAMQAKNFNESYTDLLTIIDNQRIAIMGVDMNEESASLIQHQLVFQAAARLMTTIDSLYDTLINRMGTW